MESIKQQSENIIDLGDYRNKKNENLNYIKYLERQNQPFYQIGQEIDLAIDCFDKIKIYQKANEELSNNNSGLNQALRLLFIEKIVNHFDEGDFLLNNICEIYSGNKLKNNLSETQALVILQNIIKIKANTENTKRKTFQKIKQIIFELQAICPRQSFNQGQINNEY